MAAAKVLRVGARLVGLLNVVLLYVGVPIWTWALVWLAFGASLAYRPTTATVVERRMTELPSTQRRGLSRYQLEVLVEYRVGGRDYPARLYPARGLPNDTGPEAEAQLRKWEVGRQVTRYYNVLHPSGCLEPEAKRPGWLFFPVLVLWLLFLVAVGPPFYFTQRAAAHARAGRYLQARDFNRRAILWHRPITGLFGGMYAAGVWANLAVIEGKLGEHQEEETALQWALHMLPERGKDTPLYAQILNGQGNLALARGHYAEAAEHARQALEVRRSILGPDAPDTAESLANLGVVHVAMGDYAAAGPLLRQAREVCRTALGERHPKYAESLEALGHLHRQTGDLKEADACYREALAIRGRASRKSTPEYADALNNLATLHVAMHDHEAAAPLFRQALEVYRAALGENNSRYALALHNLAAMHTEMNDPAEAERLLRESLRVRGVAQGEDHPDSAATLGELARLFQRTGRYAEAEPLYRRAADVRRAALGERHPAYALTLHNLGHLCLQTGQDAAAESLLRQALDIWRAGLGEEHPHTAFALRNLGDLAARAGRPEEALALMRQAAAVDDRALARTFALASETQRLAYLEGLRERFDAFLSLAAGPPAGSPEAVAAALDLVLRRKAVTAEALAVQREAVLGGRYPALRPKLEELTALRRQAAQKALAGPGPEGPDAHREQLAQWDARRQELEAELARQVPELELEARLRQAGRAAVAAALPAGSALAEFVRFQPFDFRAVPARGEAPRLPARYLAFVLMAGEPESVRLLDLGEAEAIDRLVADFRAQVTGTVDGPVGRDILRRPAEAPPPPGEAGEALRAAVFDPLAGAAGAERRLFLAPDGDLARLPFEALPDGACGRLLDAYQLSYLGCGRDVLRFGAAPAAASDPVVAADPDFDLGAGQGPAAVADVAGRRSRDLEGSGLRFGRLPGTRREGEYVAGLLGVPPWLGAEAVEGRLKGLRSPRVLHLATHGFFLSDQDRDPRSGGAWVAGEELGRLAGLGLENPLLRSGLALAGANTWLEKGAVPGPAEDGLLTAEDVTGLDLSGTELVVLSACDTGLGEVRGGEGVFGLRRAFTLAGARALVMSLWKVPDQQTQELMADFYRRLLQGRPRAEALREAQQALKARHPEPRAWAAFICLGDPGPLALPRGAAQAGRSPG